MTSEHSNTTGILGVWAYSTVHHIPSIINECSALIPLVCHLANYEEDHRMFPKLGYLDGIWRLLDRGLDFFDRANTKSEASYKVWDVNWGSVFTRANGSATSVITDYALRKHENALSMPEDVLKESLHLPDAAPAAMAVSNHQNKAPTKSTFRRYQELHIIRMSRQKKTRNLKSTLLLLMVSRLGTFFYYLILVALIIVLCLLGAFGSAGIIATGLVSKIVCLLLRAERPSGYLENNEHHGACMLSAVHENANTWYLYVGDRGVIDSLLNKTMLSCPPASWITMIYFRLAHVLQLLAMTFVAAQKGIDGVCLVVLLLINCIFQYLFGGHQMARKWLEAEHVSVDAHSFRFSGRTAMLGAIHINSEAREAPWMVSLLMPRPRIKVWLEELKGTTETGDRPNPALQALSSSDRSWVLLNSQLAIQAARLIRLKLSQGKTTESLYIKGSS